MYRLVVAVAAILLVLNIVPMVRAESEYAYVLIEDVTGRVWSYSDVQRLLNTSFNGYIIGDYFYLVIDNDTIMSLRDMVEYNGFAAFRISPGEHSYLIQWYGYRQVGKQYFSPGYNYLRLNTAPFLPIQYEWSDISVWKPFSGSEGIGVVIEDGLYRVVFRKGLSYIELHAWDPYQGERTEYLTVEVYDYPWVFHLDHFGSYDERKSAWFIFKETEVMNLHEEAKVTNLHGLLRLTYLILITKNKPAIDSVNAFVNGFILGFKYYIDLALHNYGEAVHDIFSSISQYYNGWVNLYIANFGHKVDQIGYFIIFEVFASPTQVLLVATAYNYTSTWSELQGRYITDIDPMPVESDTAFYYNNTVVKLWSVYGGYGSEMYYDNVLEKAVSLSAGGSAELFINATKSSAIFNNGLGVPAAHIFVCDDVSRYGGYVMLSVDMYAELTAFSGAGPRPYSLGIEINVSITLYNNADMFENMLMQYNYVYTRSGDKFNIRIYRDERSGSFSGVGSVSYTPIAILDISRITRLVPSNTPGELCIVPRGWVYVKETADGGSFTLRMSNLRFIYVISPRIQPISINMYTGNYTRISSAYAVQLLVLNKSADNRFYVPSYYIFSNPPKRPVVVDRDIYYDNDTGVVHIVYVMLDKRLLTDRTIWNITYTGEENGYLVFNCTTKLEPVFQDTIISLFDLGSMSFLKVDPEWLMPLLAPALPPGEYGVPVYDWATGKWVYAYDYYTINKLIEEYRTRTMLEKWEDQWNSFYNQYLAPLAQFMGWLSRMWLWLLLGFGLILLLILVLAARGSRVIVQAYSGRPR